MYTCTVIDVQYSVSSVFKCLCCRESESEEEEEEEEVDCKL